jgi:hypothetical protein
MFEYKKQSMYPSHLYLMPLMNINVFHHKEKQLFYQLLIDHTIEQEDVMHYTKVKRHL